MNMPLTLHLFRRLIRGRRMIGMVALASVPGLVAWISLLDESGDRAVGIFREITAGVPVATLSIACLFLGTAVLRDERDGGTLPFLFISPMRRVVFAVSAWLAAVGASVLAVFVGWLVTLVAVGATQGEWAVAWPVLAAYVAAAIAYSAVFVPLGYLFSRSLIPGLIYVFVWEGILVSAVPGLAASSVWRIALSIYGGITDLGPGGGEMLGSMQPGVGGGVVTVGVLCLLGVTVLTWAMKARDAV